MPISQSSPFRLVASLLILHGYLVWDLHSFYVDNNVLAFDCGGTIRAGNGTFQSPYFPEPYPPDIICTWVIRAQPGNKVLLQSVWFSVEAQPDCAWDQLVIQDGLYGEYGSQVHCGSEGFRVLSTSNVFKVVFATDASGIDLGFQIKYEEIGPPLVCNKTISQEGIVTSPYYPSPYPDDVICHIVIQAPNHHTIQIDFTDFDVESQPCHFDRLEILESRGLARSLCGTALPPSYTSLTNTLTLRFVSDASISSKGFSAYLRFLQDDFETETTAATTTTTTPTTTTTTTTTTTPMSTTTTGSTGSGQSETTTLDSPILGGCNQTVKSSPSIFNVSSPLYPSPYEHVMNCVTKLRSDVKSTYVIKFYNFSIEEGEDCTYDSLSIYTGSEESPEMSETRTLLRRMCGTLSDDVIVSWEGHGLDLVFSSDQSFNDAGYLANVVVTPVVKAPRCPDVCQNGGSCAEVLLPDGSVDWVCVCTDDYTGVFCEIPSAKSCLSITCHNGGTCRRQSPRAVCLCPTSFTGIYCEQSIAVTDVGGALFFTKMSGNTSLSVGSSAILECAVNDAKAKVMWLFHDRTLSNSDWSRGVEVHPGGVIVIRDAKDELAGRYTCMAVTLTDLIERSLWIDLMEPCTLEVSKGPKNMTVKEGQAALFQCYVPDADVTLWRKDGDLVNQGPRKRILVNHYLVINPVVETDAGQYTCAARGANGCFSKTSGYLEVKTRGHEKECGRPRNPSTDAAIIGRISSGREAPPGSAPWHVILREQKKDTTFCGGSLISRDTVLTAAHCISHFEATFGYPFHPRHIQLYIGTNHCVGHNGIYRGVKWHLLHEAFNTTYYNNDIAVFKLDSPVDFSEDVMPICLERPTMVAELMKPGRLGVITGCGGRHAQGIAPTYLHEVQIPIVSRDVCRERAGVVNTSFTDGMFCAGYARSMRGDACAGDSGGAFTVRFHDRSILVGIVSWGVGCDWQDHYGYYVMVAHYYDWILDKIEMD